MALPTLAKTWQFAHGSNSLSGVLKTDFDAVFIGIKNALKAFGVNPWTVVGSSNGSSFSMAGVDHIATSANIVNANTGTSHSWLVLRQAVSGAQLLFNFNSASANFMTLLFSPSAGFTGGSVTTAPTATDSITMINATYWMGNNVSTGGQYRYHVMQSTDGLCTRIFICTNSIVASFIAVEKPGSPATGWAHPVMCSAVNIGNSSTFATLLDVSSWLGQAKYSSQGAVASMPLTLTYEEMGQGNQPLASRLLLPNEISGEYILCPVGLWHETTIGQRGKHGFVVDMYFTAAGPVMGDTYPGDGSKAFQQMGQMVVPSDGNAWLIS